MMRRIETFKDGAISGTRDLATELSLNDVRALARAELHAAGRRAAGAVMPKGLIDLLQVRALALLAKKIDTGLDSAESAELAAIAARLAPANALAANIFGLLKQIETATDKGAILDFDIEGAL